MRISHTEYSKYINYQLLILLNNYVPPLVCDRMAECCAGVPDPPPPATRAARRQAGCRYPAAN